VDPRNHVLHGGAHLRYLANTTAGVAAMRPYVKLLLPLVRLRRVRMLPELTKLYNSSPQTANNVCLPVYPVCLSRH